MMAGTVCPGSRKAPIYSTLAPRAPRFDRLLGPRLSPGEPPTCVDVQPQMEATLVEQTTTTEDLARRERKAKRLAAKLFFELDRQGIRYSLRRTAGVSGTVRRENLSLDEVERELDMWKLRGPHGG